MPKMTPEEKFAKERYKRLFGEVKYKRLPPETSAVVETRDGKRRLVRITQNPLDLSALTFGKKVFTKGEDNVFREQRSEAFYSLPAGIPPEASYEPRPSLKGDE